MATHKPGDDTSSKLNGSRRDIEESRHAKIRASLLGGNSDSSTTDHDDIIRPIPNSPPSRGQSFGGGGSAPPPYNNDSGEVSSNWIPLLIFILLIGVGVYFLTQKSEEKAKIVTLEVVRNNLTVKQALEVPHPEVKIKAVKGFEEVVAFPSEVQIKAVKGFEEVSTFPCGRNDVEAGQNYSQANVHSLNLDNHSYWFSVGCARIVVSGEVTKVEGKRYKFFVREKTESSFIQNDCGSFEEDAYIITCKDFVERWRKQEIYVVISAPGYLRIE